MKTTLYYGRKEENMKTTLYYEEWQKTGRLPYIAV